MEIRRFAALADVQAGLTQAAVAKKHRVTPGAVSQWMTAYRAQGRQALRQTDATGRPVRITPEQKKKAERALLKGPEAFGYGSSLWTLERVAHIVNKETGIRYRQTSTWRLLRSLGWSVQKPATRARERNEKKIKQWVRETFPRIQKRGFA